MHQLGKIAYNTNFDSEEIAYAFQSQASDFLKNDIAGVIDEVCGQLDDPHKIIYIEKLEFNLGNFFYTNSKQEIVKRFRQEFYNTLCQKIADLSSAPSPTEKIIHKKQSELLHLTHFLEKGSLNWNSPIKNSKELEATLDLALKSTTADFIKWLKKRGHYPHVRKRIIFQLKDPQIIRIIEKTDPANAPFIARYATGLQEAHKEKHLVPKSENEFRNLAWEVIWAYVFSDRGSRFNRKAFVKHTLEHIAIRNNVSYGLLLGIFSKSVPKLLKNQVLVSEFPELIIELEDEYRNRENTLMQEKSEAIRPQAWAEKLIHTLEASQPTGHPGKFIEELQHSLRRAKPGENILTTFTPEQIRDIVQVLHPSQKDFILQFADYLENHINPQILKNSARQFTNIQWEAILIYLLEKQGNTFNQKDFVAYTLKQTAIRAKMKYGNLLGSIPAPGPEASRQMNVRPEIQELLFTLKDEQKKRENHQGLEPGKTQEHQKQYIERLNFLQGKSKTLSTQTLQNLILVQPDGITKQLRHYILQSSRGENIRKAFTIEQLKLIALLLEPSQKNYILQFAQFLETHFDQQKQNFPTGHFAKIQWEAILVYLLEKPYGTFNPETFTQNIIREISACYDYSYTEALTMLLGNIRDDSPPKNGLGQVQNLLIDLRDKAVVEYPKRIHPHNEVLHILYAHELWDEITFYLQHGYPQKKFTEKPGENGPCSLLQELENTSQEMVFRYLAYLQKEKHLQQLLQHTSIAFIEATALLYFKYYHAATGSTLKKFSEAMAQPNLKTKNKTHYTWLFTKLIHQRSLGAANMLKEIKAQSPKSHTKTLQFPIELFTLRSFLFQFLKEEKTDLHLGISYAETWQYVLDNYPGEAICLLKSIINQPGMFKSFVKLTGHKGLPDILIPIMPSAYARNLLLWISGSFMPPNQSLPETLKTERWQILFETVIENRTINETEITRNMLSRFLQHIKEPTDQNNYLQELKKHAGSFSFMEKRKLLETIHQIEGELHQTQKTKQIHKQEQLHHAAMTFLQGQEPGHISQLLLLDYIERYFKEKPEHASNALILMLHNKKARAWWTSKLPERLLMKIMHLASPTGFIHIHNTSHRLWDACLAATVWHTPGNLANKWFYMFEALNTCTQNNNLQDFGHEFMLEILKNIPVYHKKEFLNDVGFNLLRKDTSPGKKECAPIVAKIKNLAVNLVTGTETEIKQRYPQKEQTEKKTFETEIDITEGTYINNAGLVLAAPCLPPLFKTFGLLEDDQFKNPAAQERTVHLLQYMADKSTSTPEFLLNLNKILCGMELENPIVLEIEMTQHEKATIEQVIQDMIQHWKAIGNTSVEGFRESFFQRGGILRHKNDRWELQVEEKAFDVLLDQVPWSFSTLKYQWMKQPLYVKWR